jgi:hypothetical protein
MSDVKERTRPISDDKPAHSLTAAEKRILAELLKLIHGCKTLTARVFTFTPNVAFVLLQDFNLKNRPKKPEKIAQYTEDMSAEDWGLTGDTVKFSDRSILRDGQNRLMACIQAQTPFKTLVVFGVKDALFDRMDRGKPRDGSDLLAIAGYKDTNVLANAIRWTHLFATDRVKQRDSYEPREILRLVQETYPTLPDRNAAGRRVYDVTKQPRGLVMATLYHFSALNARKADDFAAAWSGGQWGGAFKPIATMQRELSKIKERSNGVRVHDVTRAAFIVIAWNLYVAGRKGTQQDFNWSLSDEFPVIAR